MKIKRLDFCESKIFGNFYESIIFEIFYESRIFEFFFMKVQYLEFL